MQNVANFRLTKSMDKTYKGIIHFIKPGNDRGSVLIESKLLMGFFSIPAGRIYALGQTVLVRMRPPDASFPDVTSLQRGDISEATSLIQKRYINCVVALNREMKVQMLSCQQPFVGSGTEVFYTVAGKLRQFHFPETKLFKFVHRETMQVKQQS